MINSTAQEIRFAVSEKAGEVSGLLLMPKGVKALLVVAHGAGAGMRHRFMEQICAKTRNAKSPLYAISFLTWRKASKDPTRKRC